MATTTKQAPKTNKGDKATKPAGKGGKGSGGKGSAGKPAKLVGTATASRNGDGDGVSRGRPATLLTEKRVHILRTLLKIGATSSATAETAETVGQKAKIDAQHVKHHCYDENPLYVAGLVGQNRSVEGAGRLLHYFITPAGVKALKDYDKAAK